jgi:hypothetical protein
MFTLVNELSKNEHNAASLSPSTPFSAAFRVLWQGLRNFWKEMFTRVNELSKNEHNAAKGLEKLLKTKTPTQMNEPGSFA